MQNTYRVEALPPLIPIGVQTEEGVLAVDFDCSAWLDAWPDMVCSAMHTRPGEAESYPVVCSMAGTTLRWEISLIDTEIPGQGVIEIIGLAAGKRKLSGKTCTHIEETSVTPSGDAPEVMQPFVDQILTAAATAKASAEEALASANAAKDAQGESAPPIMASASGAVVTISDASARAAGAVTTILPVLQLGDGVPSEDNPRDIQTHSAILLMHEAEYTDASTPKHMVMLPEGVYGGRYDWISGKLEITYGLIRLAGSDRTWQLGFGNHYTAIPGRAEKAKLYSDRYVQIANPEGIQPGEMALGLRNSNVCFGTDLPIDAWKAKLDEQPLEIVYELAEPVVVQLEPTRIAMLDGDNALWSDAGDTEVAYIVDTKAYVDSHAGEGSGGAVQSVQSVNGKIGKVTLTAADVGALDKDAEIVDVTAREGVDALSEEIEEIKNTPKTEPFSLTGAAVTFDNVADGTMIKVVGNAEASADTTVTLFHSGENLIDVSTVDKNHATPATYEGDGWVSFELAEAQTSAKYVNAWVVRNALFQPSEKYRMFIEISNETSIYGTAKLHAVNKHANEAYNVSLPAITDFSPGVYAAVLETKATFPDILGYDYTLRSYAEFAAGAHGKIRIRPWVVKVSNETPVDTAFVRTNGVEYPGYTCETKTQTIYAGHSGQYQWGEILPYDGVNTIAASIGTITVLGEKEGSAGTSGGISFKAKDYGLPILAIDGNCDGMTKDDYVSLAFSFMGMSGTMDVKKQGSSSINTGIEIGKDFDTDLGGLFNFTLKFPEPFEAKEGWGAQKKYCFKANAIDHSHARNVCSCKLWGEIVKSRANVPTELSGLVNGGAIDGFPIVVVLNGNFYALGTFNIPKDGWMFGSPKAILCADAHTDATKFKALATLNGDFELEYVEDEDNADWVLPSINTAIQAAIDGNLDTLGQYIDIQSAIDYYIHTVDENADDGTDKNYILVTFDGVKWYFSAYDRDTTYGLYWNGKTFTSPRGGITYAQYATVHQVMNLIYTNKKADLKARAVALRDGIRSEINVCDVFTKFAAEIPAELLAQNCRRWPLLRSTNASNTAQILNWYRLRRQVIDKEIDGWPV